MKLMQKRAEQNPEVQKRSLTTFTAREGAEEDTEMLVQELRAMQRRLSEAAKARKLAASESRILPVE